MKAAQDTPNESCCYHSWPPVISSETARLLQSVVVLFGPVCLSSHQHVPSQSVCRSGLPEIWGQITVGQNPSPQERMYDANAAG